MILWSLFLKLKFKYLVSFICIITLYVIGYEKRFFQINSNWKILCHESSISLCEFDLKVTDIYNINVRNLAVFSKSQRELHIVDLFSSSMTNSDILSSPKILLLQEHLDNYTLFDIRQTNDIIQFVGVDTFGTMAFYSNWNLIFTRKIINETLIKEYESIVFQSLDLLSKENLILLSGLITDKTKMNKSIIYCLNASDGSLIWNVHLKDRYHQIFVDNQSDTQFITNSDVFNHWKLNLIRHHKNLNHLKQKSNHLSLLNHFPITFFGKNLVRLLKSQKTFNKKQLKSHKNDGNYNSILVLHVHGLSLLDVHTGSLLANEDIEFDTHSTYSLWPSNDYQQKESIFQVKFVSKLDHYSKDHMDINHDPDMLASDTIAHQHKIHCNLIFHKLNPETYLTPEVNNWFLGHLCDPVSYMDYPRFSEKSWLEDPLKSVPPLITNDYAAPSGLWGRLYHLIGRKLIDKNTKNVVCISSDGLMTSLSSHGHHNWRTNAQVGWLHISRMVKMSRESFIDSSTKQVYEKYFHPSLTELTISYLNQTLRAVLSLGFDSLSVVDLNDGYLLASHSLPCTPVDNPIIINVPYQGIFSASGDIIIVIKCENMVIGFSIIHFLPWSIFITLCSMMIGVIVFLMWSLDPANYYFGEFWV